MAPNLPILSLTSRAAKAAGPSQLLNMVLGVVAAIAETTGRAAETRAAVRALEVALVAV